MQQRLADRSALLPPVLLVALGPQVLAPGPIGAIIMFGSGKRIKDYTIARSI